MAIKDEQLLISCEDGVTSIRVAITSDGECDLNVLVNRQYSDKLHLTKEQREELKAFI